jgi:hypothetical protein
MDSPGLTPGAVKLPFLTPVAGRRWRRTLPAMQSGRRLEIRCSALRTAPRPLVWHGLLRFPANRIHKALLEAVTLGVVTFDRDEDAFPPSADLWRFSSAGSRDQLAGTIGFRLPPSNAEQETLTRSRSLLIKLQYVLWARAIAETDGAPDRPVIVTLSQLCEDLGYVRLANGAHRPEHKRQVQSALDLLTSLRIDADYRSPDRRLTQLTGPLWKRHAELETDRTIAYSPGDWHSDPVWAKCNSSFGLASAGLLKLRPDRDRWAIAVGGYLAALSRMNGYRPLTLRVSTLLERSDLATAERRNPGRMRDMLERALDRLEAVGVIGEWDWSAGAAAEPDMDAADDLSLLAETATEWSSRSVIIRWPSTLQRRCEDLQASREQYWRDRRRGIRTERQ